MDKLQDRRTPHRKMSRRPLSSHRWHCILRPHTRLSRRLNNNICKPHIVRNIVRDIKQCEVLFFPQSYSRSQTELHDNRSVFYRGLCVGGQKRSNIWTTTKHHTILHINTFIKQRKSKSKRRWCNWRVIDKHGLKQLILSKTQ